MKPVITAYRSTTLDDVSFICVLHNDPGGVGTWYRAHDGAFELGAEPDTVDYHPSASEPGQFYDGTPPSKLLPGTIFVINIAPSTDSPVVLEVHERKSHGIAPLFGAPRRTLSEIAELPFALAVPITRKFSDDAIVPGARLTHGRTDSPVIVVAAARPLRLMVVGPDSPLPFRASRIIPRNRFTARVSIAYRGNTYTRESPELSLVPAGNCEMLLPGTLTNRGLVISLSSDRVVIEDANGLQTESTVYMTGTDDGRMFIDLEIPPTILVPAVWVPPMKQGELWVSHTGEYLVSVAPRQVILLTEEVLDSFWRYGAPDSFKVPDGYLHTDGHIYPCSGAAKWLRKTWTSPEKQWAIVSRMSREDCRERAEVMLYSSFHDVIYWSGLPVAQEEFYDRLGTQLRLPYQAYLASRFTCGLCSDPDQDLHDSHMVFRYVGTLLTERCVTVGNCCLHARRVLRCPECSSRFAITQDERLRNQEYCPRCTTSGRVTPYHGYSYKPAPKFFGTGPLFFGVELELATSSVEHMKNMADAVAESPSGDLVYAKTDSSIGAYGLEFVTHPFSLEHIQANPVLLGGLMAWAANTDGWTASSSCGIHIHTSKKGYSVLRSSIPGDGADKLTEEQLLTRGIFRAQKFVYGNPKLITHFAGRESSRYASLAIAPGRDQHDARITGAREALRLCRDHGAAKSLRYSAMNFTEHTIEYRVFKSTKDYNELLRNILFIDSVVQYARHHAMPKTKAPDLAPYRKFLDTQEYYAPVRQHFDAWTGAKKATPDTAPKPPTYAYVSGPPWTIPLPTGYAPHNATCPSNPGF